MTARTPKPAAGDGPPLTSLDAALFGGVNVRLDARLGSVTLSVKDLLALRAGETVRLDARLNDLVELQLNGALIGRGEIVAAGDAFAVRLVEIAPAS
ncbi:hypothetical protein GCM10017620_31270 [Brevundimonas intermedia]|uniref:Flagellar motor switch protein FliN-like C-terminal domain-containing protein n=1 Tax=Brevundimonas intermedia TaxID=74315 RepID=A0ABQ5TCT1_9CAUL|nr:FliM/FliN family flagellar motor switch protein [Brevundimonas intermedia]GLK50153.1 hypothetical protein GCM10017620_31270 [Brevundimonas intermedia]